MQHNSRRLRNWAKAFLLWVCDRGRAFTAIEIAFRDVNDIALPDSAEEYFHTTEDVHMRLDRFQRIMHAVELQGKQMERNTNPHS